MDAPFYPPSAKYSPPKVVSKKLGIDTVSIRELLEVPAIRDLLFAEAPGMKAPVTSGGFLPHLGNFTLQGITNDGMISGSELKAIKKRLAQLPPGTWPDATE